MVIVLIALEVFAFTLIIGLFSTISSYLEQYNAERDLIMKSNALFIGLYLTIKMVTQLMLILHYEGTLLTSPGYIKLTHFLNDMAIVFFYIAFSLNFYKWLVIINRVYLYAGKFSDWRFKIQNNINVSLYVFFVIGGAMSNFTFMTLELITSTTKYTEGEELFGAQKENSLIVSVILLMSVVSLIGIGLFLVNRLRAFFKTNYFQHSQTILYSIALMGPGVLAMLAFIFFKY